MKLPKNNLDLVADSKELWLGIPITSIILCNWSVSELPGNNGCPNIKESNNIQ